MVRKHPFGGCSLNGKALARGASQRGFETHQSPMIFNMSIPSVPEKKPSYPKTASELLDYLNKIQRKKDEKTKCLIENKENKVSSAFSIEVNGRRMFSVLKWRCPHCHSEGMSWSENDNGYSLNCWHCAVCDRHTDFKVISCDV